MAPGKSGPVLVLSGEARADCADGLRELLISRLWNAPRQLTIDAAGLRFADTAVARVLVVAARLLHEEGGCLVLLHPQPQVARLLDAAGAAQVIAVRQEQRAG